MMFRRRSELADRARQLLRQAAGERKRERVPSLIVESRLGSPSAFLERSTHQVDEIEQRRLQIREGGDANHC